MTPEHPGGRAVDAPPRAARPHVGDGELLARSGLIGTALAADFAPFDPSRPLNDPSRRVLFRGGTILSMDPRIGDLASGDVLIVGDRVAEVGRSIEADATVIDAAGMIVMPGLVDAHRHLWANAFRRAIPDADMIAYAALADTALPALRPEDVAAAVALSDLATLNTGVTCLLDYAHMSKSPQISHAAIEAHIASGLRTVYAYARARSGPSVPEHPGDLARLRDRYFGTSDQLVTLRLGTGLIAENYALARRLGIAITSDGVFGAPTPLRPRSSSARLLEMARTGELGPDVTLIHGTGFPPEVMTAVADSGACLVLSPTSDAALRGLGNATPPIQGVMDTAMFARTGLSVDVETSLSTDLFAQMHAILTIQRLLANRRWADGADPAPAQLSARDVLTMATIGGARASGLGDVVGSLTPGKQADIVLVRGDGIANAPLNNAVGTAVIGATVADVEAVFVAGRLRKWRGDLPGVDQPALVGRLERSRDALVARAGLGRYAHVA